MDLSRQALPTYGFFFFKFQIHFRINGRNHKVFKRIARCKYLSKCNVLYLYQWIRLDKLYRLMESFLQISKSFFELPTIFKNNCGVGY